MLDSDEDPRYNNSDVDWASNVDDRKSMSGICVFLGGNLITWTLERRRL